MWYRVLDIQYRVHALFAMSPMQKLPCSSTIGARAVNTERENEVWEDENARKTWIR